MNLVLKMTGIHDILTIYFFSLTMPVDMQDLSSSSRDQTCALCGAIMESQSLDGQGSPTFVVFKTKEINEQMHSI